MLALRFENFQHRIPFWQIAINALIAAAIVWLCCLIPIKARPSLPGGIGTIICSLVIWNLPGYAFLPAQIGHAEPFVIVIITGTLYSLGISMIPAIASWIAAPSSEQVRQS